MWPSLARKRIRRCDGQMSVSERHREATEVVIGVGSERYRNGLHRKQWLDYIVRDGIWDSYDERATYRESRHYKSLKMYTDDGEIIQVRCKKESLIYHKLRALSVVVSRSPD